MKQPYKRMVLLHVAILVGGVPILLLHSPLPLLLLLIVLKIFLDIHPHRKEHMAGS